MKTYIFNNFPLYNEKLFLLNFSINKISPTACLKKIICIGTTIKLYLTFMGNFHGFGPLSQKAFNIHSQKNISAVDSSKKIK
jgi:hypothetical protein